MKKHTILFCAIALCAAGLRAEAPANYYASAEGKTGEALRQALYKIISGHTNVGYDGLWNAYKTTDVDASGKIWDIYSTCSFSTGDKCGSYGSVCDCYNREHTVPQSWFGSGNMKADLFNVYPTDGKVNGQRSNYPYGECSGGKNLGGKALGKLGTSTFSGYTSVGTVFEPVDQYKGDLARSAFYCATAYANDASSWGHTFGSTSGLSAYGIALFMKWTRNDAVSEKEIDRNDAIQAKQRNRNPFIDHPELAEYIWGDKKGQAWYSNGSTAIKTSTIAGLEIYPNPAKDFVTITAEADEISYSIVSLSGQTFAQGNITSGQTISLENLQTGVYLLKISADGRQQIEKLLITK